MCVVLFYFLLLLLIVNATKATEPLSNVDHHSASTSSCDVPFNAHIITSQSITVPNVDQVNSFKSLWSYLLYRWSIILYFVPLIVIILCKCKLINSDVRLMYGSDPDDTT
ncbi:hypothetical protein AB6A40_009203 [Gnathostoma spinigerum]|uniref:Uncharacterized protein n=1 Tax=Gnathostoma spinigerum TaxID=75299 RepID=A0ABD6EWC7_9BILA